MGRLKRPKFLRALGDFFFFLFYLLSMLYMDHFCYNKSKVIFLFIWYTLSAFAAYKRDGCLSWHCRTLQEVLIRSCTFVLSVNSNQICLWAEASLPQLFSFKLWPPVCVSYVMTAVNILVYILPVSSSLLIHFLICKVNFIVYLLFHNLSSLTVH